MNKIFKTTKAAGEEELTTADGVVGLGLTDPTDHRWGAISIMVLEETLTMVEQDMVATSTMGLAAGTLTMAHMAILTMGEAQGEISIMVETSMVLVETLIQAP